VQFQVAVYVVHLQERKAIRHGCGEGAGVPKIFALPAGSDVFYVLRVSILVMRRIYHRFPQSIDLDFELVQPFRGILTCIARMHDTHTTVKEADGLVKERIHIQIADGRTKFLDLDDLMPLSEKVTEAADFRVSLQRTLLTPEKRLPVAENVFYLRIIDKGPVTECYIAKEGRLGDLDAMDLRRILKGACE